MVCFTVFFFLVNDLAAACGLDVVLNVHIVDEVQKHSKVFKCHTFSHLRLVILFACLILAANNVVSGDD